MEQLQFQVPSRAQSQRRDAVLVGVVGSGNCEVLLETTSSDAVCIATVHTAAHGFSDIWRRVIEDFATRCNAGGLRVEINDVGATPAVVTLRLYQAIEAWESGYA